MEKRSIEAIVGALNAAQVRYLIAGGLAVIAHGHVRFTKDVDLIVDFETSNLHRAIAALSGLSAGRAGSVRGFRRRGQTGRMDSR